MGIAIVIIAVSIILIIVFHAKHNKQGADREHSVTAESGGPEPSIAPAPSQGVEANAGEELLKVPPVQAVTEPDLCMLLPRQFIVLDLETTGLDSYRDEIIEFGAIRVNLDSNTHASFQTLIKPVRKVPLKISEITGITQEMVDRDGLELSDGLTQFIKFIGDSPLVTFNAEFDMGFLCNAAKNNGLVITNRYTCALKRARRAWPGLPSYRLADLATMGKLSNDDNHRALGDCKRAAIIFTAATSTLGQKIRWSTPLMEQDNAHRTNGSPLNARKLQHEQTAPKHGDPNGALHGEIVVFTGELSIPRSRAVEIAARAGCEVHAGITKHTTILVAGVRDVSLFDGKEKSDKYSKAESLMRHGQAIRILTEAEFMQLSATHVTAEEPAILHSDDNAENARTPCVPGVF